jgi:hypothetical protein
MCFWVEAPVAVELDAR